MKKINKRFCNKNTFYCLTITQLHALAQKHNINTTHIFTRTQLVLEIINNTYIPQIPVWGTNRYVTNIDIRNVLTQWNGKNNFLYLGCFNLINKKKIISKLTKYLNNDNNIGIVLWHEYHWMALWVSKNKIYYFDSEAIYNIRYIYIVPILLKIKNNILKIKKMKISYNLYDIQTKNNIHCGIYVIDFIKHCIFIDDYDKWINDIVKNKSMEYLRDKYFINK